MAGIRRVSDLGTQGVKTILDGSIQTADIANNAITQTKLDTAIPLNGFKNYVINGDFRVWQRVTATGTSSATYTGFTPNVTELGDRGCLADRWRTYGYGSNTTTMSRQSFTVGAPATGGFESQYFIRVRSTTTQTFLGQIIEGGRNLSNESLTISFWAKASTGTPIVSVYISQYFGTGGSPSASVQSTIGSVNLSTSWQRYSVTATLPSVSGKTFGTNGDDGLELFFASGTLNVDFDFWGIQLEAGSIATPFERRPLAIEMELCQRYYYLHVAGFNKNICHGHYYSSGGFEGFASLPTRMRTTPTLRYKQGTNFYGIYATSMDDASYVFLDSYSNDTMVALYENASATGTAGQGAMFLTRNAASFVAFEAEW